MALTVKHKFVSPKTDSNDASLIQPSNWNDDHEIIDTSVDYAFIRNSDAYLLANSRTLVSTSWAAGVSDPYWGDVRLALEFNGTDGQTTTTDASPTARTVTLGGGASIQQESYLSAPTSLYIANISQYVTTNTSASFTGDYTIECYINAPNSIDSSTCLWYASGSTHLLGSQLRINNAFLTPVFPATANVWYHVAVVRSGSITSVYINGQLNVSGNIGGATHDWSNLRIGSYYDTSSVAGVGYYDNFRVTAAARYTANFTPPPNLMQGYPIVYLPSNPADLDFCEVHFDTNQFILDGNGKLIGTAPSINISSGKKLLVFNGVNWKSLT